MSTEVLGAKQLQKKLSALKTSTQNKLERSAVSAGLRATAKAIKSEVPSAWKEGRKAIGYSFVRGKGKWKGMTFAKAGVGAGIRKKARDKKPKADRSGRKGIGIGVANFHWFILGTAERETGSKRVGAHRRGVKNKRVSTGGKVQKTGRMEPNPIVQRGAQKSRSASLKAMADNFKAGIEREAAKK
jgi:hypothetical protein